MDSVFTKVDRSFRQITQNGIKETLNQLKKLKKLDSELSTSEALEILKITEIRRQNDILCENGDIFDRQLEEFAERFKYIEGSIDSIRDIIRETSL